METLYSGLHNYTGIDNPNPPVFKPDTAEDLTITVITNTSGNTVNADSRTFVYRQDGKLNALIDVLEQSNSTTTTADITNIDTTIPYKPQTLMFPVALHILMVRYLNTVQQTITQLLF